MGSTPAEARLLAKSPGILAGVPFFDEIFKQLGCTVEWNVDEGKEVGKKEKKECVAIVKGPTRHLLLGERVALNVLARCSGIATKYGTCPVCLCLGEAVANLGWILGHNRSGSCWRRRDIKEYWPEQERPLQASVSWKSTA